MITALNQIILSLLFLSACIIVNQLALAAKYKLLHIQFVYEKRARCPHYNRSNSLPYTI